MKKIYNIIFLFFLLFLATTPVYGTTSPSGLQGAFGSALTDAAKKANYNTDSTLPSLLGNILFLALSLLGAIFIIMMVYGGYEWMTAGGNEQKVDKAGEIIRQAIIGLIVVVGAYAISYYILQYFPLADTTPR